MNRPITREFCKAHGACYDEQPSVARKVNRLVPEQGLTLSEGARLPIPPEDVVWLFTRPAIDGFPTLLSDFVLWEWSARTVDRAMSSVEKPDPRSVAVVAILRRLAAGEKIPQADLDAAWAAARAARDAAWAAARAAASSAAWAAWAAAWAARDAARAACSAAWAARAAAWAARDAAWAARDAARADERNAQVADLIELLGGDR